MTVGISKGSKDLHLGEYHYSEYFSASLLYLTVGYTDISSSSFRTIAMIFL